jgi:lipid II isoglutaminyl synthase (glutamine-hydrolysing)
MTAILYGTVSIVMRVVIKTLRLLGTGGTSLPGILIEKIMPQIITHFCQQYEEIIIVTGTNGKTTTQCMISHILRKKGFDLVQNASGSNMFRGIATTIVSAGKRVSQRKKVLLLEVEEATMPKIARYIMPTRIIITNFFRDQLDAYGELDRVADCVFSSLKSWPDVALYANYDDPTIKKNIQKLPNKYHTKSFSLGEKGESFMYEGGEVSNTDISVPYLICKPLLKKKRGGQSVEMTFTTLGLRIELDVSVDGLYNLYNVMGALAVCCDLGIGISFLANSLSDFSPPFGRGESIIATRKDKELSFHIYLVKNPAGMTQVWEMLLEKSFFLLALNNHIADGRDVSWIWDSHIFKGVNRQDQYELFFTGTRAHDMAIRFKYADFSVIMDRIITPIHFAIETLFEQVPQGTQVYILATYTAMNEIRDSLAKYANIKKFQ